MSFRADECAAIDDAVRFETHAVAEIDFIADDAVRPDETVVADASAGTDNGCGMNRRWMSGGRHE